VSNLRNNLFFVTLALSLLGVVMVYSATYRFSGTEALVMRLAHLGLGIGVFFVVSRVRYTVWRRYVNVLYGVVLVALVAVLIPGVGLRVNGSSRWLDVGFMTLQPSEFAKIAAVVFLSCALARLKPGSGLPLKPLAAVGVLFGLVLIEPDFGTSVVLLTGVAGALWASEVRTKDLLLAGAGGLVFLATVMLLAPYRRERFMTFLDPWAVADTTGYQNVQAMIAIKAGGVFGSGAGSGGQGANVPEIDTDMIFALIGEELGVLGMTGVIAAFSFVAVAGVKIALEAPSVMARCLAAGLTTMLVLQAVFNMGAAMVVLPLAGITLPFVSYGGSSLLVSFAAVGILYRISEDSERAREIKPRSNKRKEGSARVDSRGRDGRARDPRAVRGL